MYKVLRIGREEEKCDRPQKSYGGLIKLLNRSKAEDVDDRLDCKLELARDSDSWRWRRADGRHRHSAGASILRLRLCGGVLGERKQCSPYCALPPGWQPRAQPEPL